MQALILLKLKPEHILQFSHDLASNDCAEIMSAVFLHGPFDCAVEVHAADLTGINEVVTSISHMAGVADVCTCTVVHSWARTPAEHAW